MRRASKSKSGAGQSAGVAGNTGVVYARLGPEQPAPLVVGRISFGDLPLQMVLTDDMRMGPMGGLSGQSSVEVVARVAVSGTVAPQAGDWQGSVAPVDPTAGSMIQLTIDQAL